MQDLNEWEKKIMDKLQRADISFDFALDELRQNRERNKVLEGYQ